MGVDAYNINGRKKLIGMAAGKKMTDGNDNGGDDVGKTRLPPLREYLMGVGVDTDSEPQMEG